MHKRCIAIIVTYNPEPQKIIECINSLLVNVSQVIIVDNGSSNLDTLRKLKFDNAEFHYLNENKGIAYAQNYGVDIALNNYDADFLFFSDQDTIFPKDIVKKLISCYDLHNGSDGAPVAVVSPFFKDHRNGYIHPSVSLNIFTSSKVITVKNGCDLFPSHVIASGMLVPKEAWLDVGSFREDLFIDWVDTEWCWRARSLGYTIVQTPSVMISHELGYGQKNFAGRSVTIHNSFRNYYKIRNSVYLMFYSKYSFRYRYHLFFHSVKNIVFEILYSKNKKKSCGVVYKAVLDAFQSKMSK